jgi:FAD dependent oxidoreductase
MEKNSNKLYYNQLLKNSRLNKLILTLSVFCLQLNVAFTQKIIQTDVLIVGGGVGGTAAALQAARQGVKVVLIEETTWLGGMLSAAGVSATDGNHKLPSGLWAEFREQIYKVYGGVKAVETGWVSNTHFEPRVADSILKAMVIKEKNITVYYGYRLKERFVDEIKELKNQKNNQLKFVDLNKSSILNCQYSIVIDATELGDVMAYKNIAYDIGMESNAITGENVEGIITNNIIQDLTYTAIVKDYGKEADKTIIKPINYTATEFDGVCKEWCSDTAKAAKLVTAQKMLDYAKLPNQKYLLNWPNSGNDTYLNIIKMNYEERKNALIEAKQTTLRFLYFIQTQLGYKNLGLAEDEFPTFDKLPLMAYHREGRRVRGLIRFNANDIKQPFRNNLYKTGIAVGDYPIDHHHKKNTAAPQHLDFYAVPSYTIPLGCLIPKNTKNFIVAEKGISVSNVVNGTTRLQPVVMLTGQAAGALAALSIQQKKQPNQINIRQVQQELLRAKAYIQPYIDVSPTHPHWESIQKAGATGIVKGTGVPYKWANQTWFYPDSLVRFNDLGSYLQFTKKKYNSLQYDPNKRSIEQLVFSLNIKMNTIKWEKLGLTNYDEKRFVTRVEYAVLLDKVLNVFQEKIDFLGSTIF